MKSHTTIKINSVVWKSDTEAHSTESRIKHTGSDELTRHRHRSTLRLEFRATPTGTERSRMKLFNSFFDSFLHYIRMGGNNLWKVNPKTKEPADLSIQKYSCVFMSA